MICWCKRDETSSSIPMSCWTLRSKVFGAMTKEHLVSEGVLPVSTMEVPTSGLTGWHIPETFPKYPTVPPFLCRTNRWQAPFVAEVEAVGVGCGLWVVGCGRLCEWSLSDFESLTFTPGKGRGPSPTGGRGKGGSCWWTFIGDFHEKVEYFTVRGRGKEAGTVCRTCWCYLGSLICSLWLMSPQFTTSKLPCWDPHPWKGQQNWTAFLCRSWQEDGGSTKKELEVWSIETKSKAGMASHASSWC